MLRVVENSFNVKQGNYISKNYRAQGISCVSDLLIAAKRLLMDAKRPYLLFCEIFGSLYPIA